MTTGIDDTEWLDEAICKLSVENSSLKSQLNCMTALLRMYLDTGRLAPTETLLREITNAEQLTGRHDQA